MCSLQFHVILRLLQERTQKFLSRGSNSDVRSGRHQHETRPYSNRGGDIHKLRTFSWDMRKSHKPLASCSYTLVYKKCRPIIINWWKLADSILCRVRLCLSECAHHTHRRLCAANDRPTVTCCTLCYRNQSNSGVMRKSIRCSIRRKTLSRSRDHTYSHSQR